LPKATTWCLPEREAAGGAGRLIKRRPRKVFSPSWSGLALWLLQAKTGDGQEEFSSRSAAASSAVRSKGRAIKVFMPVWTPPLGASPSSGVLRPDKKE